MMEVSSYSFSGKLAEGEKAEQFIARCMSKFGQVHLVSSMAFQKVGIDAFMSTERWGYTSLQFKQCRQAQKYGNAFVELEILNEKKEKTDIGWAYKTTANHVVYWTVGMGKLFIIDTMELKRSLPKLVERYRIADGCSQEGGRTWYGRGVCVPLLVLCNELSKDVLDIREDENRYFATEV